MVDDLLLLIDIVVVVVVADGVVVDSYWSILTRFDTMAHH